MLLEWMNLDKVLEWRSIRKVYGWKLLRLCFPDDTEAKRRMARQGEREKGHDIIMQNKYISASNEVHRFLTA
jgi:hypothetical protein